MSQTNNDILMERASDMQEYWTGTVWERIIMRDIESNDLEALAYHISLAEKEAAIQEDYPILEHLNELG